MLNISYERKTAGVNSLSLIFIGDGLQSGASVLTFMFSVPILTRKAITGNESQA